MWTYSRPTSKPTTAVPPAIEPITLAEAKRHVFVAPSDDTYDSDLIFAIQAAREQWENDTDSATTLRTLTVNMDYFSGQIIKLPSGPLVSVTSVDYYDIADVTQELATSVYSVDLADKAIRLNTNESWPTTSVRWDAVTIEYIVGYGNLASIPAVAKQAMLLLIGYYTMQNRGDNDRPNDMRAYESLVNKFMRSSYP